MCKQQILSFTHLCGAMERRIFMAARIYKFREYTAYEHKIIISKALKPIYADSI
jgi:hypothetical protein